MHVVHGVPVDERSNQTNLRDRYFMLLGYHIQTNNQDNFLSTDFGLKEFNVKSKKEKLGSKLE
jgi:hypothetical protein